MSHFSPTALAPVPDSQSNLDFGNLAQRDRHRSDAPNQGVGC